MNLVSQSSNFLISSFKCMIFELVTFVFHSFSCLFMFLVYSWLNIMNLVSQSSKSLISSFKCMIFELVTFFWRYEIFC